MSGSTGFTSTSGWRPTACARWWSSARAPTGRRSSSRSRTGTAKVPRAGRSCCEGCSAAGSRRPWSRLAMGPWGSGAPSGTCGPRRPSNATGSTSWAMSWTSSRNVLQPKAKRALHDILAAETREQARGTSRHLRRGVRGEVSESGRVPGDRPGGAPDLLRLSGRTPGFISGPRTSSNRRSPRSACGNGSPRGQALAPRAY